MPSSRLVSRFGCVASPGDMLLCCTGFEHLSSFVEDWTWSVSFSWRWNHIPHRLRFCTTWTFADTREQNSFTKLPQLWLNLLVKGSRIGCFPCEGPGGSMGHRVPLTIFRRS